LGPFKQQIWDLPASVRADVSQAWEEQFGLLFDRLNVDGTRDEVERFVSPRELQFSLSSYLEDGAEEEDVSDLAD
jgi:hypothetical protein